MTKNKTQVLLIHGGTTFGNKKDYLDYLKNKTVTLEKKIYWSDDYLTKELGDKFEIIRPRMPMSENAKYAEWKILFERYIPLLSKNLILIGVSLGATFLAKYLSENKFPKKILSTYLICPPFDNTLLVEELLGGFSLKSDLSLIEKNCQDLNLFFSKDDNVVPISHAKKFEKKLPNANIVIFESKSGHFQIEEFPEIVKMIKED